jgi:hypothetical protein
MFIFVCIHMLCRKKAQHTKRSQIVMLVHWTSKMFHLAFYNVHISVGLRSVIGFCFLVFSIGFGESNLFSDAVSLSGYLYDVEWYHDRE